MASLLDRYMASMILSGVGDALGFRNGGWEFCMEGAVIHKDLKKRGGLDKIKVALPGWRVSDDTVMHLATAEGLVEFGTQTDKEVLYSMIAAKYKECMNDMGGRSPGFSSRGAYALEPHKPKGYCVPFDEWNEVFFSNLYSLIEEFCWWELDAYVEPVVLVQWPIGLKGPMATTDALTAGMTCTNYVHDLKPLRPTGYQQPFNRRGGGCGAAMRAMCIGLRYPSMEQIDDLIAVSCESGRMTHHHPTGYLGAMSVALFTAFSIQGRPVKEWGSALMAILPRALQYIESQGRYVEENRQAWNYFTTAWTAYLKLRGIKDGTSEPQFPKEYGVKERDSFYKSVSYDGWGGASGHDAPMIAYDALLAAGDNWEELCKRAMLHGGDSDSTGVIAGACYGAMYGLDKVYPANHQSLEYRNRLQRLGIELYKLNHPDETLPEGIYPEEASSKKPEGTSSAASQASGHC